MIGIRQQNSGKFIRESIYLNSIFTTIVYFTIIILDRTITQILLHYKIIIIFISSVFSFFYRHAHVTTFVFFLVMVLIHE